MKTPVTFILLFLILSGCATTGSSESNARTTERDEENQSIPKNAVSDEKHTHQNLADYLQQIPGVNVSGQSVTIRGVSSINSGTQPLFVIDGQVVGTSYMQVNSMVNVRDIDYVRVLKGTDAAIYGVRGGNGVILIVMKK